jgi:catechol 2,3-dioxygenase-like lactoylglutathione lyase family enzyme
MKRLHLHVKVGDLERSIAFYSELFGALPSLRRADYAKWLLEDPRVNFAISQRGGAPGLDHLGLQVDGREELEELSGRLEAAGRRVLKQQEAACCYAVSDKAWTVDPDGLSWETFHSTGEITRYGDDSLASTDLPRLLEPNDERAPGADRGCCT